MPPLPLRFQRSRRFLLRLVLLVAAAPGYANDRFEPDGLFLTWQRDPTRTMTIDWHTAAGSERPSRLDYRIVDSEKDWQRASGDRRPFPFAERWVHRVEVTQLQPATTYEFRFGEDSRVYRFRTMPENLHQPLRFAAGGDTMHAKEALEKTNRAAMEHDLDFIVWGGDLAYADGREDRVGRWFDWFDAVHRTLVAEDGRVVPIVLGIGNHEVQRGYYSQHDDYEPTDEWRERIAPYFYGFFAFPGQPGYASLDFGDYLSLIVLDTDHSNPIEGAQTQWLAEQLAAREPVPHLFPIYHVPGWPSHRPFAGSVSQRVREHWVPLFEKHGVRVAFEHHDHTYKRTHPIRAGQINPEGIVYMGDGAWGVDVRAGDSFEEWYIAKAESKRHFILVTLEGRQRDFQVFDSDGNLIDQHADAAAELVED